MHVCIYIYIINVHTLCKHKLILDAINRLTALVLTSVLFNISVNILTLNAQILI